MKEWFFPPKSKSSKGECSYRKNQIPHHIIMEVAVGNFSHGKYENTWFSRNEKRAFTVKSGSLHFSQPLDQ